MLAHALRETNRRVLVLERGPHLPREADNWNSTAVFADLKYRTADRWVDASGQPFRPEMHYYVGGNSKFYGGVLWRLRPSDFGPRMHVDGESAPWPIGYQDLEPCYSLAESIYGVRGSVAIDPNEPTHSAPYEHAAPEHEPPMARPASRFRLQGLRPFPQPPIAVGYGDGGRCIRCQTCDGFPCRIDAKGDAEVRCLRPALRAPNIELRTRTMATQVVTTAAGDHAVGVEIVHNGRRSIVEAGTVVAACGAVNSAAVLLRSTTPIRPDGVGNSSGLVGKNYMQHTCTLLMAIARPARPALYFGAIGPDAAGQQIREALIGGGVNVKGLVQLPGRTSTSRIRVDEAGVQHFESEDFGVCDGYLPDAEALEQAAPGPRSRAQRLASRSWQARLAELFRSAGPAPHDADAHRQLRDMAASYATAA